MEKNTHTEMERERAVVNQKEMAMRGPNGFSARIRRQQIEWEKKALREISPNLDVLRLLKRRIQLSECKECRLLYSISISDLCVYFQCVFYFIFISFVSLTFHLKFMRIYLRSQFFRVVFCLNIQCVHAESALTRASIISQINS